MNIEDRDRFVQNREWFNGFFAGVKQIFERSSDMLSSELGLPNRGFYYPKTNFVPSLPPYYFVGLGGDNVALQIVAVFDPTIVRRPFFNAEPSLFVVEHTDGGRHLYFDRYAGYVLGSGRLEEVSEGDGVLTGQIPGGARFHAFQIVLDYFMSGQDVDAEIKQAIVDKVRSLPPLARE